MNLPFAILTFLRFFICFIFKTLIFDVLWFTTKKIICHCGWFCCPCCDFLLVFYEAKASHCQYHLVSIYPLLLINKQSVFFIACFRSVDSHALIKRFKLSGKAISVNIFSLISSPSCFKFDCIYSNWEPVSND